MTSIRPKEKNQLPISMSGIFVHRMWLLHVSNSDDQSSTGIKIRLTNRWCTNIRNREQSSNLNNAFDTFSWSRRLRTWRAVIRATAGPVAASSYKAHLSCWRGWLPMRPWNNPLPVQPGPLVRLTFGLSGRRSPFLAQCLGIWGVR